MVSRATPALAVLLLVVFAGCVKNEGGQPAETSQAGPAVFEDGNGAIEGLITDGEHAALPGALVGLVELPGIEATTDTDGRFVISNVAPGTYALAAQKLGYEPKGQKVDVVPGQATEVRLILEPLPIKVAYPETIIFNGIIKNGIGVVRTATCTSCGADDSNKETIARFPGNKLPKDYAGIMIEATWKSRDYIGVDVVDRDNNELYWRTRSLPGVHFLLEKCASYIGAPHFGRSQMPCADENISASKMHIENWYIGEFQQETHTLDEVCRTPVGVPGDDPVVPGYAAGCYGLGFVPELRFSNYVTVFHLELPPDAAQQSFMPDA